MDRMNGESLSITEENIKKLKELFPECVTENYENDIDTHTHTHTHTPIDKKIDFDKLRELLGDEVDSSVERYNFTWPGKSKAIKISQTPSTGTLRPCKEESKNWNTTENLYIEGDNLEVHKK